MDSRDEKHATRTSAGAQPNDDTYKKLRPATLNDDSSAPDRGIGSDTRPVRINREGAQKNIPPDPDDPVSP